MIRIHYKKNSLGFRSNDIPVLRDQYWVQLIPSQLKVYVYDSLNNIVYEDTANTTYSLKKLAKSFLKKAGAIFYDEVRKSPRQTKKNMIN